MQTFLPFPDFEACARALDDRRLGKQRVETFQILRALTWPTYGWKNHPAVAMWRGFTPALVLYGLTVCAHWRSRGYSDVTATALLTFTDGTVPRWPDLLDTGQLPPWLGDEAFHASHREALLRKAPGHYAEHFEPDGDAAPPAGRDGYVWPDPVYPRWPVLLHPPRPLPAQDVAGVLGGVLPDALPGVVHGGRDAVLEVADQRQGYRAGVAAALLTGRRVLWAHAGADLPLSGPAVEPAREPAPRQAPTAPAATRSIARPPTQADAAAVRAAARQRPHVVFARPQQLRRCGAGRLLRDVGLVLLDPARPVADRSLLPDGVPVVTVRTPGDP